MAARVLVIGFDAAEPTILERLAAEGRAATIAGLGRDGTAVRVR